MTARVLVVGGGPAGLAAATTLARRGVAVTLAESGTWPRPKMCGEFLSPDAESALDAIGAGDVLRRLDAPTIDALRVTVSRRGRALAESAWRLDFPGHGVARLDLDAAVADVARAAGVDVRERCRIESLAIEEGCVRGRTAAGEIVADAVIAATGRVPGLEREDAERSHGWVAVKMHVRGLRTSRATELHFVDGAYVGLNEVACRGERVVNVCALAARTAWERAGATPDGLWDSLCRESPAFAERMRAGSRVPESFVAAAGFGFAVRGARGDGARPAMFVGDAAALIAPLCGDGQAMALCGGAALGGIVADRANSLDLKAVRAATAAWDREFRARFRGRLALGRALQAALLRPRVAAALVRTAANARPLAAWLYRGTRGAVAPAR